ncbi:ABC transporter permease [Aestuariivita sp.]|jgi:ABC-type polysaccharide/polyol phosphate export permease|uniref:ABC transporter permease n=1 Tax=Aestuariivita sp. TaxID=1872407 RepID=UPI00217375E7|nr:ABC transporter permease [Aestuariivita sp.]MCE8005458.1 ABC transporter permease [Aestuariivita sp.]
MFEQVRRRSRLSVALGMADVIYHSIVRDVRKQHGNAILAIGVNMLQIIIFVAVFYVMFSLLGLRGPGAIRGDFMIYLLTGIFLYMTNVKTLGAVMGAEGPSSAMMQHAPMNTIVAIGAAALGALYIQVLTLAVILFGYHVLISPITINDPAGAFMMFLLAWFAGIALGLVLLALKPWFPTFTNVVATVYKRANMIASGKMFVANTLPGFMIAMFDWNPLFHIIDQSRGYAFINYYPRYTNWEFPLIVCCCFIVLGLMGEFYTRRHASLSWDARR